MIDQNEFMIDLQLFAEKEEDDDFELVDGDMDHDEEEEDTEDLDQETDDDDQEPDEDLEDSEDEDLDLDNDPDADLEDEEEEEPKAKPDKVTKALIEEKRRRKEAERKIREMEEAQAIRDQEIENEKKIRDLVRQGYGEAQAKTMVASDARSAMLERRLQKLEFEKLEGSYPGISDHMDEILKLQSKSGGVLTVEEIYRAKFRKSSEADIKIKAEAEALHRQKQAAQKKGITASGGKSERPVKLSKSEENAYQLLIKQPAFKNMSRREFQKSLNS